tara:strand:+ start:502 stop:633 length:132 start_codon:yes stop_codon:yes gene_type:complete
MNNPKIKVNSNLVTSTVPGKEWEGTKPDTRKKKATKSKAKKSK